jgi:hypothetical protein
VEFVVDSVTDMVLVVTLLVVADARFAPEAVDT